MWELVSFANGRVYDPAIGRFISAAPNVPYPFFRLSELLMIEVKMEAIVNERLIALRQRDLEFIQSLPEVQKEKISFNGEEWSLVTYHDKVGNDEHLIVVQAGRKKMLGMIYYVWARGFVMNGKGDIRSLTNEEMAPFE